MIIHNFSTGEKNTFDVIKQVIEFVSNYYKHQYQIGKRSFIELYPSVELIKEKLTLNNDDINYVFNELKNNNGNIEKKIYKFYTSFDDQKKEKIKQIPIEEKKIEDDNKQTVYIESIQEEQKENTHKVEDIIMPAKKQNNKKNIDNKYNNIMFPVFKAVILLVGLAFIYIGIKYNYYGNLKNKDLSDSFICAFAFMLMAIICFEIWLFYFQKKKKISWFFLFLYLLLFTYNTGTIMYYQYEKYQEKNVFSKEKIKTKKDLSLYNNIKNQISITERKQKDLQDERDRQFKILNTLDQSDDSKKYSFYFWNIRGKKGLDEQIDNINLEIKKLRENMLNIESNSKIIENEKKELFTGWMLLVYLFLPSFTIEFLASICLALLLFLKFK